MNAFRVHGMLSNDSVYGVVWSASLRSDPSVKVAVKMVILCNGLHYDRQKKQMAIGRNRVSCRKRGPKGMRCDKIAPRHWLLQKFSLGSGVLRRRKCMTKSAFGEEVTRTVQMAKIDMGPKCYGHWIELNGVHKFGFIVTELCDSLGRGNSCDKNKVVAMKDGIKKLHAMGYVHGDSKPANMCLERDAEDGKVTVKFLDCARVRQLDVDIGQSAFDKAKDHDLSWFERNVCRTKRR